MFLLKNIYQQFGFAFIIVIAIILILYIGYNLLKPSECTTCTNTTEGFVSASAKHRDMSLILKKNWNTYIFSGQNYLAEIENPAKNKYVIYQTNIPLVSSAGEEVPMDLRDNTYLSIPVKLEKNMYYQLECIIENDLSTSEISWDSMIQISQHSTNNSSDIFVPNKQIFSQVLHWQPKDPEKLLPSYWNSIQILFKTSNSDPSNPFYITFILPQTATRQYIIYRDLKIIHKTLHLFPIYDSIQCYTDSRIPESYNGNGSIWRDLSNHKNSLRWNLRPFWSNNLFHLGVHKLLLSGPSSDFFSRGLKPDDVEFSIILRAQMNQDVNQEMNDQSLKYIPLVTLFGNQNIAFELLIPNKSHHPLKIICADMEYLTENIYDPTLNTTYMVTYSDKKISMWVENLPYIQELDVPKIYLDSNNFQINRAKTFNGTMTAFMLYDIELQADDVGNITSALNNYPDFYQQLQKGKTILNIFTPLPSIPTIPGPKQVPNIENFRMINVCPEIRINKQTREYEVYSSQINPYRKDYGRLGILYSSPNKEDIFAYFTQNFAHCPIPNKLLDQRNLGDCPFREGMNPCKSGACKNVIWNNTGFMDYTFPAECRREINDYCQNMANTYDGLNPEPMCECWRSTNKATPECREMKNRMRHGPPKKIIPGIMKNAQYPEYLRKKLS
jgi:hypothetical protein